jgi:hypothetical protein
MTVHHSASGSPTKYTCPRGRSHRVIDHRRNLLQCNAVSRDIEIPTVNGNRCQSGGAMACLEVKAVERRGNCSDRPLLVSPPPNIPGPSGCLPLTVDPSSIYTRSKHDRRLSALGNPVGVVQ